jgi:hypothetical protein
MATGKGSHFSIDIGAVPGTPTILDPYLRAVAASNEAEEVDATVVTSQKREFEPTYERDRITLRLKATTESLLIARDAKGKMDVEYVYGPFGNVAGKPSITGTCHVLRAQSIPNAEPGTLSELEIELNINTEVAGVFPVVLAADEGRARGRDEAAPRR